MPEEYENAIEWLDGQKTVTVTLHSQKIKNRVLRLAEQRPDKVTVIARPTDKGQDGYLYARIPASWLKISPPIKLELTEEERERRADRLKQARKP